MDLARETYLFLDCQTTGLSPQRSELLEIGWSFSFAPEEVHTRLLKPQSTDISKAVWKVTGLKPEDVSEGHDPAEVWKELLAMANRHAVKSAVIHYSQFELPFLKALHGRVQGEDTLPWEVVCTCRVAQRVHPGLPARTLRALSGRFGFALPEAHRSLSHIQATQKIWESLIVDLKCQGIETWERFQTWSALKPEKRSKKTKSHLTPRETRLALPGGPGVYEFFARDSRLLYVGKATSLRSRVNSYYTQRHTKRGRMNEMMTQAADIRVTETATALEAALLENDKIKSLLPPYNTALRGQASKPFYIGFDLIGTSSLRNADFPWGPFSHTHTFESLQQLVAIQKVDVAAIEIAWLVYEPAEIKEALEQFLSDRGVGFDDLKPSDLYRLGKRLTDPPPEDEIQASIQRKLLRSVRHVHLARWRCWLTQSRVWWQLPSGKWRFIEMRDGLVHGAGEEAQITRFERPRGSPYKLQIDRTTYDRIRILMTELLIIAKKWPVCVQVSPTRAIRMEAGTLPEWLKPLPGAPKESIEESADDLEDAGQA